MELAGDSDGVTLMARCRDDEVVRQQLSAHYPQARIQEIPPEEDPMRLEEGEEAWGMTLAADGPVYLPLRTFRDDDLLDPGSDPILALIGALSTTRARLLLRSLGPDWSAAHMDKAIRNPATERRNGRLHLPDQAPPDRRHPHDRPRPGGPGRLPGLLLDAGRGDMEDGPAGHRSYNWHHCLRLWGWWRWRKARSRVHDPLLIY